MIKRENQTNNSGVNEGVMIAENNGNVNITLKERTKIPSLIAAIVQYLGVACVEIDDNIAGTIPSDFKTDNKIEYNSVVRYKEIIKEYSMYYDLCNNHLNIYDNCHIRGKTRILKCIHLWYLEEKGKILQEFCHTQQENIEIIKQNSDVLIDRVKQRIYNAVKNAVDNKEFFLEDLELGVICFTCYCFMECKILEKPE